MVRLLAVWLFAEICWLGQNFFVSREEEAHHFVARDEAVAVRVDGSEERRNCFMGHAIRPAAQNSPQKLVEGSESQDQGLTRSPAWCSDGGATSRWACAASDQGGVRPRPQCLVLVQVHSPRECVCHVPRSSSASALVHSHAHTHPQTSLLAGLASSPVTISATGAWPAHHSLAVQEDSSTVNPVDEGPFAVDFAL
eukprot:1021025-Rhodomonas_salina.3